MIILEDNINMSQLPIQLKKLFKMFEFINALILEMKQLERTHQINILHHYHRLETHQLGLITTHFNTID